MHTGGAAAVSKGRDNDGKPESVTTLAVDSVSPREVPPDWGGGGVQKKKNSSIREVGQ